MLERMEDRGRSADRLVAFTDAVVAIAITLLALPLVELGTREATDEGRLPLGRLLDENAFSLIGFAIGFFVIARLWWAHHRVFGHVVRWSGGMVVLNTLWLFTIVLLPVATSITTAYTPQEHPEVIALYLGLMTVSSGLMTSLAVLVLRRPELTDGRDPETLRRVVGSAETTVAFVLALVIGTAFPVVNYLALIVLAITGRFDGPIVRGLERRRSDVR